ncbi:MAG TPA: C39 family peptidase [Lacipirellulaceae bacterium]|nr:C39 family peptidase [Lacipirellulaceae bacterium]
MKSRFALALASLLSVSSAAFSQTAYPDARINDIPHVKQHDDFCGEACVEMMLRKLGKKGDQNYVFDMSGLDPLRGRGCYSSDLARALKRIGFKTGNIFISIDAARAGDEIEAQWKLLHADLVKGIPSIVCMRSDASPNTTEHMRLIVGFEAKSDALIYLDPAGQDIDYQRMTRTTFLSLWPLKYERSKWLVIRFRMEAGDIREPHATIGFTNADYAQHIIALKKRLPDEFSLFIQRPFVVVGDGPSDDVKFICHRTVKWAIAQLKRDYFQRDPNEIITIWLFKDDGSYRKYAKSVFNDEPTTPFGYYSAAHRALIMNIATGTGTLVHEIVHPFVRANFPNCPAWLNEGLGSLYEQCGQRDGHIVGYTNWRLAGLQRAIRDGTVPTFKVLTGTTDHEFYAEDRGTNYAQSRYLCYYLQEHGKLTKFYRDFVANQKDDPTGYKTLVKTLGEDDMEAFQMTWEKFVLRLTFP